MSPEKFARMDADKRKAVIFGLVVVGACCFVAFPSLRSLTGGRAQLRKPPLFVAAQGTVGGNAAAARAMQGAWQGQSVIERTSGVGSSRAGVLCIAQLEIRGQREDGRIAAYSSITCLPLGRRAQPGYGSPLLAGLTPSSAILSGAWQRGAIDFRVEKTIGVDPTQGRCATASYKVTGFGATQILSEWQDDCGGGQLLMRKTGQ